MSKKANWNERIHIGQKFNRLTVLDLPEKLDSRTKITCRCDCGNEKEVSLGRLLSGHTKSCGCLMKETVSKIGKITGKANMKKAAEASTKSRLAKSIFHGDTKNEYRKIAGYFSIMHKRANSAYYRSLGRTVCEEWSWSETGYQNFKNWLLSELNRLNVSLDEFNVMTKYHSLTVDRINNDLGYSQENCRLANITQQARNRHNSYKFCGKHILDYADELSIPYKLAYDYYYKNEFGKLLDYYNNSQEGGDTIDG